MAIQPDRLELLDAQHSVTGIDFIYVYPGETSLDVYFLNDPTALVVPLPGKLKADQIRIYSPDAGSPDIIANIAGWSLKEGRNVLQLTVPAPGDFSLYKLHINNPLVDEFYNDIVFSFKANCPSDLDCKTSPSDCPPDSPLDFPVDYLARDYNSFLSALTDFASQRYPDWPDRLEADAGMMMAEVMSAMGDEMAYYQDRVSRESYLETATRRRSLRRLAALVDYTIGEGMGSTGWLDIDMNPGQSAILPSGIHAWAIGENGSQIDFETGHGLTDAGTYPVDQVRNFFTPHIFDKNAVCLKAGATRMYLEGNWQSQIPFDNFPVGKPPGKWVLLKTTQANPAQPTRSQLVRLITIKDDYDTVLLKNITQITWETEQALEFDYDLTQMVIRCNQVPITGGKKSTYYFIAGASLRDLNAGQQASLLQLNSGLNEESMRAIERIGIGGAVTYLFSLPGSDSSGLVYLAADPVNPQNALPAGSDPGDPYTDAAKAIPEILLEQVSFDLVNSCWKPVQTWHYKISFISENTASGPEDTDYILEDGFWRRLVAYQLVGKEFVHRDYADDPGTTIRFGNGEFGLVPAPGTVFRVQYRLGNGNISNVSAGAIKSLKDDRPPGNPCNPLVPVTINYDYVTNPFSTSGGVDQQTPDEVRQLAPEAFQAVTFRAVRPEDYAEAAERLTWVQNAGAAFRWTGSWLSCFVTPDPLVTPQRWSDTWVSALTGIDEQGRGELEESQRVDLEEQLDRFRQAGREAWVLNPVYANLDMKIEICAAPTSYPGNVEARVLVALMGKPGFVPITGYFSDNHFTFGTLLDRSTLEAAIQLVPGVKAVEGIMIRRRGWFDWKEFTDFSYDPGKDSIIRLENDPNHPEKGILSLHVHGGA